MGTAGYMSPEQARGQEIDFHSDQFSLGTILYEMATGKRAFRRKTAAETLVAIIRDEPAPLSQAAPQAPAPVRWIVERCLAKDPEERYASTKDLARDLKSVRNHLSESSVSGGLEAAAREGLAPPMARPRRRRFRGRCWPRATRGPQPCALRASPSRSSKGSRFAAARSSRRASLPTGRSVIYGAAWDGSPVEIFTTRPESPDSKALGLPSADLLAVSRTGDFAISLGWHPVLGWESLGPARPRAR